MHAGNNYFCEIKAKIYLKKLECAISTAFKNRMNTKLTRNLQENEPWKNIYLFYFLV